MTKQCKVLLVGSDLSVKGGIVSVLKNYLSYQNWDNIKLIYVPTHADLPSMKKILFFIQGLKKIRLILKKGGITVAHIHVSERGSFIRKMIVIKLCKRYKVPVILHHHGAEFDNFYDNANVFLKKRIQKTLKTVDLNIVLSKQLISMIKSKCPGAKVLALPNAVSVPEQIQYNQDARNILLLGELNERKGVYLLLEAISHMDSQLDPDIKLYLCGNGDLDKLKRRIQELHLEHRIDHIGWVEKEQKKNILHNTQINVLPSYNEGLPMTILETMAYGIPNLATAVASIPEVITEEETGYLMEPGNVSELEEKLWKLLKDPEQRLSISRNSYNLVKKEYSLDVYIGKLKKIYGQFKKERDV